MKNNSVLCEVFSDDYAPCMVQLRIVNKRLLACVIKHVIANGGPNEETALLASDESELEGIIPSRRIKEVLEGYPVRCLIDRFTTLTVYGYDANSLSLL